VQASRSFQSLGAADAAPLLQALAEMLDKGKFELHTGRSTR